MKCEEAQELITALVDREISAPERGAIEEHFEGCPGCRLIYHNQLALKQAIRETGVGLKAPAALRKSILHDTRIFNSGPGLFTPRRTPRPYLRPALAMAAALVALLVLPVLYLTRPAAAPLSLRALEVHEKIVGGELSFVRGASAEEIKEMLSRSAAGAFAPMTYDLKALNLKVVGGTVWSLDGRKVLVTVYQGGGRTLTCYTFLGSESDAPRSAERVFDPVRKINFYTYSHDGIHAVLHREGNLICILASSLPAPQLLGLARSGA